MVRVAPLNIPLERRLQTFAVWLFLSSLWISFALIFICLSSSILFYPFVLYVAWIFLIDKSQETGGRPLKWIRGSKLWTYYFKGFFPINLIRTAELDPSKKYLFGYHPHGVLSFGAFGNFAAQGKGDFQHLFPGIDLRLLTLETNFKIPFHRELLLSMGCASVSRKSCDNILKSGKSIMIVIGGASEALDAHPQTYDLTLLRRKGFVKVAIQNGACLVPVFSFGENDLYDQVPNPRGSFIRNIQTTLQNYFGFSLPFIKGRGIFLYDYGILPHRKMIITVVGKPIEVTQKSNPSEDDINKLHEEYLKGLQEIFDQYKDIFAQKRKKSIAFVQ